MGPSVDIPVDFGPMRIRASPARGDRLRGAGIAIRVVSAAIVAFAPPAARPRLTMHIARAPRLAVAWRAKGGHFFMKTKSKVKAGGFNVSGL